MDARWSHGTVVNSYDLTIFPSWAQASYGPSLRSKNRRLSVVHGTGTSLESTCIGKHVCLGFLRQIEELCIPCLISTWEQYLALESY